MGVSTKDSWLRTQSKTSKDSNHTRRSKQNTYHVVNKNIAPSKVTDGRRQKRGCLPGASPSLEFWLSLTFLLKIKMQNIILINSDSCVSLPKGVYNKDDRGKLKSKDSDHSRRSNQNTYHVVNKNIAPSKVTDERRRKRGCLPGHPQA